MNNAKWLVFEECDAPLVQKKFCTGKAKSAVIQICGLGFFELYINDRKVSEDVLTPAWTDYEPRENRRLLYPLQDTFTHRILYREYDVTEYLVQGENCLEVLLGNGWYNQHERNIEGDLWYGSPKLCFSLKIQDERKHFTEIVSDETMQWKRSIITFNNIYMGERQDFRRKQGEDFRPCKVCEPPKGELCLQECPPDKKIRTIVPKLIFEKDGRRVFDVGENISGHVRFVQYGEAGSKTSVRFSENIREDFSLDFQSAGGEEQIQNCSCIGDGKKNVFEPRFTWYGFRYFEIEGNAEQIEAVVVHSDIAHTASFHSDSEALNWLYDTYVRTELDNMHCGVLSDCPHRERLGYTGDGQITCDGVMMLFDSRKLFEKWMQDIADSQDKKTGHVQHTAPFYGGGGGPGGWGSAVVAVPYFYYKHYGSTEFVQKYLPAMQAWTRYMDAHSENGLVVREEEGGWCLGEWCTPDKVQLPEAYVNTYFYIKSLDRMAEMEAHVGWDNAETLAKRKAICDAFHNAFYDAETHSYCGGVQGADAFAMDLGLGDEKMAERLSKYYDALGEFDTGFFGTEVLIRILFEKGYEDTAYKLLVSEKRNSFGYQRKCGATTLWETWAGYASHNHPMFGGCVVQFIYALLGIGQEENGAGFQALKIEPKIPTQLNQAEGSVLLENGRVSVKWEKKPDEVYFEVALPQKCSANFRYKDCKQTLHSGINIIHCFLKGGML